MKLTKNTKLEKIVDILVKASFIEEQLSIEKVEKIIDTLKKLSPGSAIKSLSLYLKLLQPFLDKNKLLIESSIPLSNQQINRIEEIIKKHRSFFNTEVIINPSLIGGFKVSIGDEVFEDSLKDKISQIGKAIET